MPVVNEVVDEVVNVAGHAHQLQVPAWRWARANCHPHFYQCSSGGAVNTACAGRPRLGPCANLCEGIGQQQRAIFQRAHQYLPVSWLPNRHLNKR